jgi:hypothetical protein
MNLKLPFISGNDGALSLVHILPDVCQLNGRQGFVGGKLPHHAATAVATMTSIFRWLVLDLTVAPKVSISSRANGVFVEQRQHEIPTSGTTPGSIKDSRDPA